MERRIFLSIVGLGAEIGTMMALLGLNLEDFLFFTDTMEMNEDEKRMLYEIMIYRKQLLLEPMPYQQLYLDRPNLADWEKETHEFINNVGETSKSFGERVRELAYAAFAGRMGHVVREVRFDDEYPYTFRFDTNTKTFILSKSVYAMYMSTFVDYVAHEVFGHGTRSTRVKYPREIFLKILHGEWKALSQAFTIPEQFFNNKGDLMRDYLEMRLGEELGRSELFRRIDLFGSNQVAIVKELLGDVAEETSQDVKRLKYNKRTCQAIGRRILNKAFAREIVFGRDLKKIYAKLVEQPLNEIYAEMVKYALLYPKAIGGNINVIDGVREVLSTIAGESRWEMIMEVISNPSAHVSEMRRAELAAIYPDFDQSGVVTVSGDDPIKAQLVETASIESRFREFRLGQVSFETWSVRVDWQPLVRQFSLLMATVNIKYSYKSESFAAELDMSFDPWMHVWEIREVQQAMDSGFVRDLLACDPLSQEMYEKMLGKIKTLSTFVNSQYF